MTTYPLRDGYLANGQPARSTSAAAPRRRNRAEVEALREAARRVATEAPETE